MDTSQGVKSRNWYFKQSLSYQLFFRPSVAVLSIKFQRDRKVAVDEAPYIFMQLEYPYFDSWNKSLQCKWLHLELTILELTPMVPIWSAHSLICRNSNILLLKPIWMPLVIFAIQRNSCSSSGSAPTRYGTIFYRAAFGRHQSIRMALILAVLKPLMLSPIAKLENHMATLNTHHYFFISW